MVCQYLQKIINLGLLYHFKRRGYRGYSMNRPDKTMHKLSVTEKEIGGIPNSSEDVKQAHAAAIEAYIEMFIGYNNEQYGTMYFQRTLEDWAAFDINNRTKHDASISSGLAIWLVIKTNIDPLPEVIKEPVNLNFSKYDNRGNESKIINR